MNDNNSAKAKKGKMEIYCCKFLYVKWYMITLGRLD